MDRELGTQTDLTPSSPRWLVYAVLVLSACVVFVLVGEIGLRVAGVSYPRTSERDPNRGTTRRPGIEWWQSEEGEAQIRINRAGFRDADRAEGRVAGTFRIAVLGDSMVEALQVPTEQRFTEVLEGLLNRRNCLGSDRVEVLNFGFSGDGTAQELMILRHHVWKYQPDMVVLGVMTGNDVRNNSKRLQNDDGRPYFLLKNGELVLDDSFRRSSAHIKTWWERVGYWIIDRSRLAQVAYEARATLQKRRAVTQARAGFGDADQDLGLDTLVYKEPVSGVWQEAWEVTEALLTLMHQEVREHNAEFLAVTLSNTVQVNPDLTVRQRLMDKLKIETLSYPDERIKAVGKRDGFQVLNLAPQLQEYVKEHNVYLHGFSNTPKGTGHWNEEGHRLVGEFLSEAICSRFRRSS
jgi:hypothetical protein